MAGSLNHSPADIVRRLLVAKGEGTLPSANGSWPIFCWSEPDLPDNVVTVYDTGSSLGGRLGVTKETLEHYQIQIRIRSQTQKQGLAKALAIVTQLDDVVRETVSVDSDTYLVFAIHRTTGIIPLGPEVPESRRYVFTINALVSLKRSSQ